MSFVRVVEDFYHKLWWNEINALAIPYHKIPRHNGHAADSNGHVDARHHYVSDRRRIDGTEICRHVDLGDAIQVANAAVHHQPAAVRGFHHVVEEVITDNGAVDFLSKQIYNQHIAGLQHI